MNKFAKVLIHVMIVAMAFVAVPALADVITMENVYQGEYSGTVLDENGDEITITKFASIVYGQLSQDETVDIFGIEIKYYGSSEWVDVQAMARKTASAHDESGDFGIAFFELKDGYYSARAFTLTGNDWNAAEYGAEVYFTVGDSYKATYTVEYYFADANGDYVTRPDMPAETHEKVSIGATVSTGAMDLSAAGWAYNESKSTYSAVVKAGGTTTLKLFYDVADNGIWYDYTIGTDVNGDSTSFALKNGDNSINANAATAPGGLTIVGWATDREGTNIVTSTEGVSTLYAVWSDNAVAAYEMAYDASYLYGTDGELLFDTHGAGKYEHTVYLNAWNNWREDVIGTAWTEDDKYVAFPTWQNPAHETQYVGSYIKVPNLNMETLESITIKYLIVNEANQQISNAALYLRANKVHNANDTANAIVLNRGGSYTDGLEITITKDQLLAILPEDDNTTLHTLYVDGLNWVSVVLLVDDITFNTTDAAINADYEDAFVTYTEEHYLEQADGSYVIAESASYDILKGMNYTATVAEVGFATHNFDESNENNILSTVVNNADAVLKMYYKPFNLDVTYDFNGGTNGTAGSVVVNQSSVDALISGEGITKENAVFMGWSATQQTETLTLDEDGVVGADATFYAVWYDLGWLNMATSAQVYNTLTEGSKSYWEAPRYQDTDAYVFSAKQYPKVTDSNYTYGVLRMPNIAIDDLVSITITYKNVTGSMDFWLDINEIPNGYTDTSGLIKMPYSSTSATITLTKDQIVSIANGASVVDSFYFCVASWSVGRLAVEQVDIVYAAEYTVEHYVPADNGYTLHSTDTFKAEVGTTVTAQAKAIAGFAIDNGAANVLTGTVAADGSLVLKVYYAKAMVNATYNFNGGTVGDATEYTEAVEPGSAINATIAPTRTGYKFMGWTYTQDGSDFATGTIDAETTLYASWYDLTYLEMTKASYDYFKTQGAGKGHYSAATVNGYNVPATFTEDGHFVTFYTWQNPEHETQYVGSVIKMPNLDMSQLDSITIRYIMVSDGRAISANTVYLRANATVTTNTNANSVAMGNVGASFTSAVELTITRDQLLATMPEGDKDVLHTLYIDGINWLATHPMIDSIKINSSEAEIVDFYANCFGTVTSEYYLGDAYGVFTKDDSRTTTATIVNGTEYAPAIPTVPGYVYDEANENNVTLVTVNGDATIKYYFAMTKNDVTYDYNGGTDEGGNSSTVVAHYGTDALISGAGITNGDKIFYGWSTTQQTNTITVDEDGLVGDATTFYAVWYDRSWLNFNNLETATVNAITEGSLSYWEAAKGYVDNAGYAFSAKQHPVVTDASYVYGMLKMPNIKIADMHSLTIRYKMNKGTQVFYLHLNGPAMFATSNDINYNEMYNLGNPSEYTTVTLTRDQLTALAGGAEYLTSLSFNVVSWSPASLLVDEVSYIMTADLASYTTEYYVEQTTGGYEKIETVVTETSKNTEVSADIKAISGYEYDAENVNNVLTGTVAADGSLVLKVYYNIPRVSVTYHYNDGTGNSTTLDQLGTEALISGDGLLRDGYIFYGWATSDSATLTDVDADGLVGSDAEFYAVWYDLTWLDENMAAGYSAGAYKGAGTAPLGASDSVVNGDIKFRTWHPPQGGSYNYGIIRLPHLDMSKLVSITLNVTTTATNAHAIFVNQLTNVGSPASTVAVKEQITAGSAMDIILTNAELATVTTTGEYVDTLYVGLWSAWSDSRLTVHSITIVTEDERFPKPKVNITYDFNGGTNASGAASEVVAQEGGERLMDGSALVRDGYTFFGWATSESVTTFDGMVTAAQAADTGTVSGATTYYAVWYGNDWLNFNDSTVNSMILSGSYVKTHTADFDGDGVDDTVAGGRANQVPFWGSYTHLQVLLPRTAVSEIASLTINAYARGFNWGSLGTGLSNGRWFNFCLNGAAIGSSGNSHAFSKASENGVLKQTNSNIAGLIASEYAVYSKDYLWYMDICATQDGDTDVLIDSIVITKK